MQAILHAWADFELPIITIKHPHPRACEGENVTDPEPCAKHADDAPQVLVMWVSLEGDFTHASTV